MIGLILWLVALALIWFASERFASGGAGGLLVTVILRMVVVVLAIAGIVVWLVKRFA